MTPLCKAKFYWVNRNCSLLRFTCMDLRSKRMDFIHSSRKGKKEFHLHGLLPVTDKQQLKHNVLFSIFMNYLFFPLFWLCLCCSLICSLCCITQLTLQGEKCTLYQLLNIDEIDWVLKLDLISGSAFLPSLPHCSTKYFWYYYKIILKIFL